MKKLYVLAAMLLAPIAAQAACTCQCVNGRVQPICERPLDLPPICSPRICPIETPSVRPLDLPQLPPLGTTNCKQQRVYNDDKGRWEWVTLCR